MTYREMARRLTELEATDRARQERVYERVLQRVRERYTAADRDCFIGFVKRHHAEPDTEITADERRVLCIVEALTLEDPDMRPCDLLGLPDEWMHEHGNGEHL